MEYYFWSINDHSFIFAINNEACKCISTTANGHGGSQTLASCNSTRFASCQSSSGDCCTDTCIRILSPYSFCW